MGAFVAFLRVHIPVLIASPTTYVSPLYDHGRRCVLGSGIDVPVLSIRRTGSTRNFGTNPRSLLLNPYNPTEDNILIFSLVEGGTYELYCLNQVCMHACV